MNEQKNFFCALILSVLILVGFHFWYEAPQQNLSPSSIGLEKIIEQKILPTKLISREEALKKTPRILIRSPKIQGSINLEGGCVDDLSLVDYKETTQDGSPSVKLFNPFGTLNAYAIHLGWKGAHAPDEKTLWSVLQETDVLELTPLKPLHLTWTNAQGVRFDRLFSIDEFYMMTVKDRVINQSKNALTLSAKGDIVRVGTPETSGFYILHEGGIGILGDKLQELDYKDIEKAKDTSITSTGGWIGFTDKYWLTALIPDAKMVVQGHFTYQDKDVYQASLLYAEKTVLPGETYEVQHRLFAGAKVLEILRNYEKEQKIDRFELAVDFGWFYFLTKPLFYLLEFLHKVLGNFGLAIIVLTVFVKALTFPLAYKTFKSMGKLRLIQPKIMQLRTLYGDDKVRLNQELMKLYQKEKANPVSGCLPLLIQGPVFFCLYKVFFVTIEMRHAPFFGWIKDLSEPDPTTLFNLFGLLPWHPPSFLMIGIWPLLMGITMVLQQRFNPQPLDPTQAKVMMIMPIMFTYLFASFPVGMVMYWTWSNLLTIGQQLLMKRLS